MKEYTDILPKGALSRYDFGPNIIICYIDENEKAKIIKVSDIKEITIPLHKTKVKDIFYQSLIKQSLLDCTVLYTIDGGLEIGKGYFGYKNMNIVK